MKTVISLALSATHNTSHYYMSEGCGIYAVALKTIFPSGRLFILSNTNGEKFSRSIPYEVTHVVLVVDGLPVDYLGQRSKEEIEVDFSMENSCSVKGPFDEVEFVKKFMGNSDSKPLYGGAKEVKEAIAFIQKTGVKMSNGKRTVSTSASKITAKLLISKLTGTYHGGIQKNSNIDGRDVLWNFVKVVDGRTEAVATKEGADGIVCSGKFYKL